MARTKGALGKKTIDKLKAQGKWDYKNNRPLDFSHTQNITLKHQNPNINAKKVPLVERLKKNPELRKTIGVSNGDTNRNTNNGDSINSINNNRDSTDSSSSNNSNNERLIETENNTEVKNKENPEISKPTETKPKNQTESKSKIKLNKELKPKTFCDACHEPIYCDANRVDTNILTSRADYFREVPRFVNLCSKCSLELSNLVNQWLLDKGCYSKYQSNMDSKDLDNKENLNDFESESDEVINENSFTKESIEDSSKEIQ